jgi:siroheme synthase-like protein
VTAPTGDLSPGYYPIFVDLRGRRVVLLGGNPTAAGKVPLLLEAGAELTVVAARAEPAIRDAARGGRLRWLERD